MNVYVFICICIYVHVYICVARTLLFRLVWKENGRPLSVLLVEHFYLRLITEFSLSQHLLLWTANGGKGIDS